MARRQRGSTQNSLAQDGSAQLRLPASGVTVRVEVAASARSRTRGLLGRDGVEGGLLLVPASGVHTLGMRFSIDVAYLRRDFTVLAVRTMPPGRIGLPRLRARMVLEAAAGAMSAWGLRPGDRLELVPREGTQEQDRNTTGTRS
ncbi:DUF192 domain-containing protein [Streptomyces sp. NPDC049585]|uniref:DUF192 domain-containing protein n=1 Tax=Streptomyces sp. NPDC049585 TaxID=3155154 RepID=UPI00342406C0